MSKVLPLKEMMPVMQEIMEQGGEVKFTPSGVSMLPLLHDRTDTVNLVKPVLPLKKYDLPLYQRDNGKYVLHRVVEVMPDGTYVMCGDNQWYREKGITDAHIIGLVTSFTRNGKEYKVTDKSYRRYCKFWIFITPVRKFYLRGKGFIRRRILNPIFLNKK